MIIVFKRENSLLKRIRGNSTVNFNKIKNIKTAVLLQNPEMKFVHLH